MGKSSVWRHRDLRIAVVGKSVSYLGDDLAAIALTLFAYDAGWGTPGVAALIGATALPWAVGAPLAGRYVDRTDSRRATVVTAAVQVVLALAAAALVALAPARSPFTLAALVVLVALMALAQVVATPAWQALLPHLVPDDEVSRAIGLSQAGTAAATVAAPALAGVLVGTVGVASALLVNAATFLVLVVMARAVRVVRRPEPGAGGDSAWAGIALVRADGLFAALLGGILVILLVIQVVTVVDVFLVREVFGAGPTTYGLVTGVLAAAGLVGALVAGRAATVRAQAWGIVGSLVVVSVLTALAGLAPGLAWVAVAFGGIGLGFGALNVYVGSFTVARTSDAVRGRAFAAVAGTTQLASVVGLGLAAFLGSAVGPRHAFVGSGVVGVVVCVVVAAVVLGALRTAGVAGDGPAGPAEPAEPAGPAEPAEAAEPDGRTLTLPADDPETAARAE